MAENYDGSLVFKTKLDNSDFKKGVNELQKEADKAQKQVEKAGKGSQSAFNIDPSKSQKAMDALGKSAKNAAGNVSKATAVMDEYTAAVERYESALKRIQKGGNSPAMDKVDLATMKSAMNAYGKLKAPSGKDGDQAAQKYEAMESQYKTIQSQVDQREKAAAEAIKFVQDMQAKFVAKLQEFKVGDAENNQRVTEEFFQLFHEMAEKAPDVNNNEANMLAEAMFDSLKTKRSVIATEEAKAAKEITQSMPPITVKTEVDDEPMQKGSERLQAAMESLKAKVRGFGSDIKQAWVSAFAVPGDAQGQQADAMSKSEEAMRTAVAKFKMDFAQLNSLPKNLDQAKALEELEYQLNKFASTNFTIGGKEILGSETEEFQQLAEKWRDYNDQLMNHTKRMRFLWGSQQQMGEQAVQRFVDTLKGIDSATTIAEGKSILADLQQQLDTYASKNYANAESVQAMEDAINQVAQAVENFKEAEGGAEKGPDLSGFAGAYANMQAKFKQMPTLTGMIVSGVSNAATKIAAFAGSVKGFWDSITASPVNMINKALGGLASAAMSAGTSLARMGVTGAVRGLKLIAHNALAAASNLGKMASGAILGGLKKLGSMILGIGNASKKMSGGMKLNFSTILRYGFGIRSLYFLFNKLRRAMLDGFSAMAAGDSTLQANINGLKTALSNLKLSFASAFTPIANIVLPYITAMVNALATAINYVGMFVSALTGKSTYKKAVANVNAVAGAADNAANSAKEAKRQLAGFDKLEILSANDGGGGGGGGGGGAGGPSFEDVAIDSGIADWAQKLKDMFAAGDYEGIGKVIADGINAAFAKVDSLIKWDNVGATVTKYVDAFCRIFNSMVANIDWDLIGRTFGDGIDTILHTLDLLLTGINWGQLGTKISVGLNGLVDQIEWDLLGKTIADYFGARVLLFGKAVEDFNWPLLGSRIATGINSFVTTITQHIDKINWGKIGKKFATGANNLVSGINWEEIGKSAAKGVNHITDMLYNAVTTFNWEELGSSIATSINNFFKDVDFAKLGATVSEGIKGVLGTLGTALGEIDWDQVARDVNDFLSNVDWVGILAGLADVIINALSGIAIVGLSVALGILDGIKNGFMNLGGWVKTNILDPFINAFKNAFVISSPAAAPALLEAAGNVAAGILEGIAGGFKNLAGWAQEHILGPLGDALHGAKVGVQVVLEKVGEWAGEAWDFIQRGKETIVKTVKTTIKKISNKAGKAWDFIKSGAGEIKKNVKTTIKKVTNKAGEAWEFVKTGAGDIKKNVKTTLKKVTNNAGEAWEFIKSGAKDIKKTIETTLKKTGDWAGSVWKSFMKGKETVEKTVETLLKKTGDWAGEAWSTFKKGKESVTKTVSIAVQKAKTWISDAWNALTSKDEKTSTVKTAVSKSKTWGADAWKALSRGGETHTSTVQSAVKKKKNAWSDSAYNAATMNDKEVTRTVKVKLTGVDKATQKLTFLEERMNKLNRARGGVYLNGHWSSIPQFAGGGVISARRFARNIPQYAAGGTPHGTAFIAGERGPEIVGHVGGRTEVLNKSQLASTMYSAVVNGMGEIGGRIGSAIVSKIAESSNAQVAAINAISAQIAYTAPLMSTGTVVPYSITKADLTELGRTFEASNEELQYTLVQAIASAANLIVAAVQDIDTTTTIDQNMITRRTIEDINRRTLMFQASPLK